MRGIEGEQVLLRLILSESRRFDHKTLFMRILEVRTMRDLQGLPVPPAIAERLVVILKHGKA